MLHSEIWFFKMVDRKTICQKDNAPTIHCSYYKEVFSRFHNRIIIITSFESRSFKPNRESVIPTRKVYDQEKPAIESMAEFKKRIKSALADIESKS